MKDEEREAFEAAYIEINGEGYASTADVRKYLLRRSKETPDDYRDVWAAASWEGWQASAKHKRLSPDAASGGDVLTVRQFEGWLNSRRDDDIQLRFHEIVAHYRAAVALDTTGTKVQDAPPIPTEAQWGGLARDIIMAWDMNCKTPRKLFEHLERLGRPIPEWMRNEQEMNNLDHVPSKGTRATLIYRAMATGAQGDAK